MCIHVCAHVCMYECARTCEWVCMHVHVHVCAHVCLCVGACVHVHVCACVHTRVHLCACVHAHACEAASRPQQRGSKRRGKAPGLIWIPPVPSWLFCVLGWTGLLQGCEAPSGRPLSGQDPAVTKRPLSSASSGLRGGRSSAGDVLEVRVRGTPSPHRWREEEEPPGPLPSVSTDTVTLWSVRQ